MTTTEIKKHLRTLGITEYFRNLLINCINRLAERCVMRGIQIAIQDPAWAAKVISTGPGKARDTMLRKVFDADEELGKPDPFCSPHQKSAVT